MSTPKILVAPLDWGLGHATRCIPIVNELIRQGCAVWIAAAGSSLQLLRAQFPGLPFLPLDGYRVFYHNTNSRFWWTIAKQVPKIIASVRHEHRWLKDVMDEYHFDVIISDNRYGLYHAGAVSVFITHQLNIKTGMGSLADRVIRLINYRYIRNFNECWVPDFEGCENLAGDLSHPPALPLHTRYTGPLSRLVKKEEIKRYDLMIILSGPEPRRTIWEKKLMDELKTYEGKVLVVRGLPGCTEIVEAGKEITIMNFLSSDELGAAIQQSEWVICRSGYSSVMDLVQLQQKAILIPTPGQPEQEYLARRLHQNKIFYTCEEHRFSLQRCLPEAAGFPYDFSLFKPASADYKNYIGYLVQQYAKRG